MPERGIPKDAEFIDELKATSLDAAVQILGGLALAKRVMRAGEERFTNELGRLGLGGGRAPASAALGDLLFSGARLQVEQVRTLLRFQRWVSERVQAGLEGTPLGEAAGVNAGRDCAPQTAAGVAGGAQPLEGRAGTSVVQQVVFKLQGSTAAPRSAIEGYTQVTLKVGLRAYLSWGPLHWPASLAPGVATPLDIPIQLDPMKLPAGAYSGVTVIVVGQQTEHYPFELHVTS